MSTSIQQFLEIVRALSERGLVSVAAKLVKTAIEIPF